MEKKIRDNNVYNTTNPAELLELKRQEALIMLDMVRTLNPTSKPLELVDHFIPKIINQLDVNKLVFVFKIDSKLEVLYNHNFPSVNVSEFAFLNTIYLTTPVSKLNSTVLDELKAEYVIPLGGYLTNETTGWLIIADFADTDEEVVNDLIFIETVGNILAISLRNVWLTEIRVAREIMVRDLEVAGKIQKHSLPSDFDVHEFLDVYAENIPHSKVAGDFYDVVPIGKDEVFICIADVSGKGIVAAMMVATLQANLRVLVQSSTSFHLIIKQLHNILEQIKADEEHYVTLFLAKFNVKSGKLAYINAGHNPPYLLRDDKFKTLTKGCIPLGLLPIEGIEIGYENFLPGDLLFLFTDGIVEQFNSLDQQIGDEEVINDVRNMKNMSSKFIVTSILEKVKQYAGDIPIGDDLSLMIVKFLQTKNSNI